jgi:hypothetical protein
MVGMPDTTFDAEPLFSFYPQPSSNVVALMADNNLYLSRIERDGRNPIEAAKSSIDAFSKFRLIVLEDLGPWYPVTVALQADNDLYLSRITRGDRNPIEAAKSSIDFFSQFAVRGPFEGGKWTLLAYGGLFCSRIIRGDTNPIEAAKNSEDVFSQFLIVPL